MDVAFYFDPICAWAWLASRWLVEVAPHKDLRLHWRSYSKLLSTRTTGLPDQQVVELVASHRSLRVVESVRDQRPDAVRGLFEALAVQAQQDRAAGMLPFSDLRGTLATIGLDPRHAVAARQERWDEAIVASMETVQGVLGRRADTPAVVLPLSGPIGFHCPRISPMPTGDAALALWDARVLRAECQPATVAPA
jgi:hypothetical protein